MIKTWMGRLVTMTLLKLIFRIHKEMGTKNEKNIMNSITRKMVENM